MKTGNNVHLNMYSHNMIFKEIKEMFILFLFFWVIDVHVSETQINHCDPGAPLRPPDGELLLTRAVLRPLRLLSLSALQHHLSLLEDEPSVPEEDVGVRTDMWNTDKPCAQSGTQHRIRARSLESFSVFQHKCDHSSNITQIQLEKTFNNHYSLRLFQNSWPQKYDNHFNQ